MNKANTQSSRWHQRAGAALLSHIYLKGIGTTLFISLFFTVYFHLLKSPAYPVTVMPFTFMDRWVSFQPQALPLYMSLWFYVSLPPALLATKRELYGYSAAIGATCLAGLIAFYFWPTAVPAANIDWTQYPEVDFLKKMDASGNACPSLHVATAVFSGVWLHYLLRRFDAPMWTLNINWLWCIGILYSTMATRQHVTADVLAGLIMGLLASGLSLRQGVVSKV